MKHLTEDFLIELYAVCIKDRNIFSVVNQYLKLNFILDDDYREVWNRIALYYKAEEKRPTIGKLKQRLTNDNTDGKHDRALSILTDIKNAVDIDTEAVLIDYQAFIGQHKFVELYEDVGKIYNSGSKEKAYDMFMEGAEDMRDFSITGANFTKVFGDFTDRILGKMSGDGIIRHVLPFGIEMIDDATGGAVTGETEIWLADSGRGKSKMLCGRGVTSARSGFKVLHVQAEGTKEQCLDNYDACWTGMMYRDLKSGDINMAKYKAYMNVVQKIGAGEIFVKSVEQFGKITMSDIRMWAFDIIKKHGELHHIIIDYFELIEPEGDTRRWGTGGDGERLRQVELARQMKNLAVELNVLLTTATQSHTIEKELLDQPSFVMTRYNLGNATRKIEPFSYFFTINQTTDERRERMARIHADKFREHAADITWLIKQDLARSRFYDKKGTIAMLLEMEDDDEVEEMIKEE